MVRRDLSFIERMASVTDVAWGRRPGGGYWVMWGQEGLPETADFASAHSAQSFAAWLDTTGRQPTVREVEQAEKSFRELEEAVDGPSARDVREAEKALRSLERVIREPPMTLQERRAIRKLRELEPLVRPVHVKRHGRRRATH